jgi:hypothetical protein
MPRFRLSSGRLETVPYPARRPWDRLHLVQLVRRAIWKLSGAEYALNRVILEEYIGMARQRGTRVGIAFSPGRGAGRPHDRASRQLSRAESRLASSNESRATKC